MLVATLQVQASNPPPVIVKKGSCGGSPYAICCKGWHICVEFCPTKVLAMDPSEDHPYAVLPENAPPAISAIPTGQIWLSWSASWLRRTA